MFWLKHQTESLKVPLKFNHVYQISRPAKQIMQSSSAATIIKIENDKSISRKHAKIEIKTAKNNRLEFILKDESKYSSKINIGGAGWQKVISGDSSSSSHNFGPNDLIKIEIHFGVFNSKFTLSGTGLSVANPCNLSRNLFEQISVECEPPKYIIAAVDSAKFHVQSLLKRFPTAKILDEKFASAYMKFLSDDGHLLYTNEITDIEIETFLISNDLFYVSIHLAETNDGETLVDDSILAEDSFEDMPGPSQALPKRSEYVSQIRAPTVMLDSDSDDDLFAPPSSISQINRTSIIPETAPQSATISLDENVEESITAIPETLPLSNNSSLSYSNRSTKRHLSVSSDELPPPKVPKKSEKRESEPKKSEQITSHTTIAEVENLQELDGEEIGWVKINTFVSNTKIDVLGWNNNFIGSSFKEKDIQDKATDDFKVADVKFKFYNGHLHTIHDSPEWPAEYEKSSKNRPKKEEVLEYLSSSIPAKPKRKTKKDSMKDIKEELTNTSKNAFSMLFSSQKRK